MTSSSIDKSTPPENNSIFRRFSFVPGSTRQSKGIHQATLIFVTEGIIVITTDTLHRSIVHRGKMFLLPAGTGYRAETQKECAVIFTCLFDVQTLQGDWFSINELLPYGKTSNGKLCLLNINPLITSYLSLLKCYMDNSMFSSSIQELKRQELFYLLRYHYTAEVLGEFLSPILSKDMVFKELVMRYHADVKTIEDLARKTLYSKSGFITKFQREFGQSPYTWMTKRKVELIRQALLFGDTPITKLSTDFGFCTYTYFWKFCKKHLGVTPSELRKRISCK